MPTTVYKKTYTYLSLLVLSVCVENFWLFREGCNTKITPYPFLSDYHTTVQWYLYYLNIRLAFFVTALAPLVLLRMHQVAKVGTIIYVIYRGEDVLAYVLWASQISYTIILSVLLLAALVVCYIEFRPKINYKRPSSTRASRNGNRKLLTNQS